MEQQTFEGTWEEILLHSSELVSQRVRLTVLRNDAEDHPAVKTLDTVLRGRVGCISFQPSNLSERTEEAFAELLESKYNPSGLDQ